MKAIKVLFVCTANMARSPMAAEIFRELAGHDAPHAARAVGTASWAMRRLTTRDLAWADVVAVMEAWHLVEIRRHWPDHVRKVRVLEVLDDYDPALWAVRRARPMTDRTAPAGRKGDAR